MDWFISDTHFSHANIIIYSNRPFKNIDEMDYAIINRWNCTVSPDDNVYHLGDFGFGREEHLQEILDQLNGRKHLIRGNHDKHAVRLHGWEWIKDYYEIHIKHHEIVCLFHYPMKAWNMSHFGSIALHGHMHGILDGNSQTLDVGVDCWDYTPVNLDMIKERLKTLPKYNLTFDRNDRKSHYD